jgi:hypothetical protein
MTLSLHAGLVGYGCSNSLSTHARVVVVVAGGVCSGIFYGEGIAMEGREFRQLSEEEMGNVVPKLQVLARSSPSDKYILGAVLPLPPAPNCLARPSPGGRWCAPSKMMMCRMRSATLP